MGLFVCSQSRLRSATAEQVFADRPGLETASAGTNRGTDNPLSAELVDWADVIFVMEKQHRRKLSDNSSRHSCVVHGDRPHAPELRHRVETRPEVFAFEALHKGKLGSSAHGLKEN